jgi:hypothetical protein
MKLFQMCALVINLHIVNSGSSSCHARAFWSLCDDVVFFFANNPYMFVSSNY